MSRELPPRSLHPLLMARLPSQLLSILPLCPNPTPSPLPPPPPPPPPRRSDFESEDDQPKKPVPDWARGPALTQQLAAQLFVDPDEIFQHHTKTCSLDEVFAQQAGEPPPPPQTFERLGGRAAGA